MLSTITEGRKDILPVRFAESCPPPQCIHLTPPSIHCPLYLRCKWQPRPLSQGKPLLLLWLPHQAVLVPLLPRLQPRPGLPRLPQRHPNGDQWHSGLLCVRPAAESKLGQVTRTRSVQVHAKFVPSLVVSSFWAPLYYPYLVYFVCLLT